MTELVPGANGPLPPGPVAVRLAGPFDVCALVVGADGKVSGDGDFVFYNQPTAPGVKLTGGGGSAGGGSAGSGSAGTVTIDPGRLRPGAERVVIAASPEDGTSPFGRLPALVVSLADQRGAPVARFAVPPLSSETVVTLVEVYRRGTAWKVRAVGQGYADGLAGLARDFGVDVSDDGQSPTPAAPTQATPTQATPPRPPVPVFSPVRAPAPAAAGEGGLTPMLAEVVTRTNAERAREGLGPLAVEGRLVAAAQAHSVDMVARGFFAHGNPDGLQVSDRVTALGYRYGRVAENIAAGQTSAAEVVTGWMNSPGHRANILIPQLRQIGVGYAPGGEYGHYWTQVFGTLL